MKLLLLPNTEKPNIYACVRKLLSLHFEQPVEFWMDERFVPFFPECPLLHTGEIGVLMKECDICIVIGGDGTIIHGGKLAARHHKPVLGINLGHLGFLATLESDQLGHLGYLLTGEYTTEERMMLSVTLVTPSGSRHWEAMNDAVLSKGGPEGHMVELQVLARGRPVGSYRADGLIFSTPTGSTAYSLSAGGPIIDPSLECIAMTPLSPHSLFSRPILFDDQNCLCVYPVGSGNAYLTIDGEESVSIGPQDRLYIEKSDLFVHLINLTGKSFYDVLNEKLIWRSRK